MRFNWIHTTNDNICRVIPYVESKCRLEYIWALDTNRYGKKGSRPSQATQHFNSKRFSWSGIRNWEHRSQLGPQSNKIECPLDLNLWIDNNNWCIYLFADNCILLVCRYTISRRSVVPCTAALCDGQLWFVSLFFLHAGLSHACT